jgi:hypothetical protein
MHNCFQLTSNWIYYGMTSGLLLVADDKTWIREPVLDSRAEQTRARQTEVLCSYRP